MQNLIYFACFQHILVFFSPDLFMEYWILILVVDILTNMDIDSDKEVLKNIDIDNDNSTNIDSDNRLNEKYRYW